MKYFLFSTSFVLPWFAVMLLRAFGPLSFEGVASAMNIYIAWFFTALILGYTFGYLLFSYRTQSQTKINFTEGLVFSRVRRVLFALAILFPIVNGIDFFLVKGASLGEIVRLREVENLKGPRGSIIGALVTFLSATPPLAMSLILLVPPRETLKKYFIWIAVVLGFGCMFLTGGRNAFFLSIFFVMIFTCLNIKKVMANMSNLMKISGTSLIATGLCYSFYLFVARFAVHGIGEEHMIRYLSFYYNVTVVPLVGGSAYAVKIYSMWAWFVYYLCHPLGYLQEYFSLGYEPDAMGAYSFGVYARIIDILFETSFFMDAQEALITNGVYLTLPGSLYIDFGYEKSLLIIGFMGICMGALSARKPYLHIVGQLWLTYFTLLFVFSPFYNALSIGNGVSFLTLLLVTSLFKIKWISKN